MPFRKFSHHLGKSDVSLTLDNGRVFQGIFHAFDEHLNVIFYDCSEVKKKQIPNTRKYKILKRKLGGIVVFRGDCVVAMSAPKVEKEAKGGIAGSAGATNGTTTNQQTTTSVAAPQLEVLTAKRKRVFGEEDEDNMDTTDVEIPQVKLSSKKTLIPPPALASDTMQANPRLIAPPLMGQGAKLVGSSLIAPPPVGRGRGAPLGRGMGVAPPPPLGRGTTQQMAPPPLGRGTPQQGATRSMPPAGRGRGAIGRGRGG